MASLILAVLLTLAAGASLVVQQALNVHLGAAMNSAAWNAQAAEASMPSLRSELRREDRGPLLDRLGQTRRALLETQRGLRRGCVPARAIDALVADIDALAGLITGDRTFFHLKAH